MKVDEAWRQDAVVTVNHHRFRRRRDSLRGNFRYQSVFNEYVTRRKRCVNTVKNTDVLDQDAFRFRDNRKTHEDTNCDGRPDVWEEFDEAEEMLRRSKDLDFDGVPDIKEDFTKADSMR